MNRSGILLSQNLKNDLSYANDGIVTAKELSSMDLSNVDLMVLSACDTGKGDYKGSEGIFGLQRALELSGVKKQIVSLWKVPDKETSELFTLFYKNYIEGNSIYHSLKQAQISMSEKYEPYYWASFILLE
jgi:CHAT domain-containing protein